MTAAMTPLLKPADTETRSTSQCTTRVAMNPCRLARTHMFAFVAGVSVSALTGLEGFGADTADGPPQTFTTDWAISVSGESHAGRRRVPHRSGSGHMQLPRVMRGVGVAPDGSIYAGGSFSGQVEISGIKLVSAGHADTMLAAFDPAGKVKWFKRFGASGPEYIFDVVCDSAGMLLATGMCSEGTDFGGPANKSRDVRGVFTAKFDDHGNALWVASADGGRLAGGNEVAVDNADNVLVVANGYGDLRAGRNTVAHVGGMDIYVLRYSPHGELLWVRGIGGPRNEMGRGITGDSDGNVIVVGEFTSVVAADGVSLSAASEQRDILAVKYEKAGTRKWAIRFGSSGEDYARGVGCDKHNNIYVSGVFSDTVGFGDHKLTSTAGAPNIFLMKLSPDGEVLWAHSLPCRNRCEGCEMQVDGDGNAYISGQFQGDIHIGPHRFRAISASDMFVAKVNTDGKAIWAKHFPSRGGAANFALAVHHDGHPALVGTFSGEVDFDSLRLRATQDGGTFISALKAEQTPARK